MTDKSQQFASDNYSGICPEAWAAMEQANHGHQRAYGDDEWTARASDDFRKLFETDCEVFFAFNGTAANSLALSSLCQSYHSVICSETAHVETDECGAPEFFSNGSKLLIAGTENGKITPQSIREVALKRQDIHYPKPRVVTLTQATEVGSVYTPEEVRAISATCKELGLHLHMDGARFANAVASLGVKPSEITWKVGVDSLCFGGTKNGTHIGDTVVFFVDSKLVMVSDTMPLPNATPGINPAPNNGSAVQVPKLLENILKLDFDTAIAGRGEPMTKADVQAYKAKWDTFMTRARDAMKKGVSKEEFMANVKQDDLGWNFNAGFFNNLYDELKANP